MALTGQILPDLKRIVGTENVLTTPEDLIPYSFDGTAGLRQMPGCVVLAKTTEQVATILKLANDTGIAVVTRGSGTGLSGGSLPSPDCIVLCTVKMDRILELDRANLTLLVEPGVTTLQVAEAASAAGLFYPPDPGSMKISTIGGNVAENSGGLRGLKYGVTRNYVMGMEVVLPTGEFLWTGNKCVKDVAGYSLKDLFVGSEGTLAIIAAQIIPCTLEFLDRMTIHCVEDYARIGLPLDCEALLLMETDGHPVVVAEEARRRWKQSAGTTAVWKCAWPKTKPRRGSSQAPGGARFPRWRAWRQRPSSRTPPCPAANWRR